MSLKSATCAINWRWSCSTRSLIYQSHQIVWIIEIIFHSHSGLTLLNKYGKFKTSTAFLCLVHVTTSIEVSMCRNSNEMMSSNLGQSNGRAVGVGKMWAEHVCCCTVCQNSRWFEIFWRFTSCTWIFIVDGMETTVQCMVHVLEEIEIPFSLLFSWVHLPVKFWKLTQFFLN